VTVEVRRVRATDLEAYRTARLRSLREDPLAFGSTLAREEEFPPERWQQRLEQGASSPVDATWVAMEEEGDLVGMMSLVLVEGRYRIFGMWVAPERRRQGLGARMLDLGLAWAGSHAPTSGVALDVNPRQAAAVRLYESRGFVRTGKSEPLGHTAGEIAVEMVRPPGG
jgi:ribosomal protein S18 acetylase RimI-like enzyme